jgi:hypothetical protein
LLDDWVKAAKQQQGLAQDVANHCSWPLYDGKQLDHRAISGVQMRLRSMLCGE